MSMSILNNISSLQTQNQMNTTSTSLQQVLQQLSTGSRLNSGADDPAALAIANGLQANTAALTQSAMNASDGVGKLQVADGALSQVTTLLNTAITLATEASNGTVSSAQQASMDNEFTSIKAEITRIGSSTTYNGAAVFSGVTSAVFLSDGTAAGSSTIDATVGALSASAIGFSAVANGGTVANLSAGQFDFRRQCTSGSYGYHDSNWECRRGSRTGRRGHEQAPERDERGQYPGAELDQRIRQYQLCQHCTGCLGDVPVQHSEFDRHGCTATV